MHVQAVPAGDNATLFELGEVSAEELHRAARAMRAQARVTAVIVGHSSLYVIRGDAAAAPGVDAREPREHRLRVAFDGVDLPELLTRVSRDEFLARVATLRLTARYLGFRGGFAYLDGWPEEWSMPRRATSRPVAAGTFAVAGNVAGFYPIDTPGGWNLLGRTDVDVEDAFVPGDVITIEPVATPLIRPSATFSPHGGEKGYEGGTATNGHEAGITTKGHPLSPVAPRDGEKGYEAGTTTSGHEAGTATSEHPLSPLAPLAGRGWRAAPGEGRLAAPGEKRRRFELIASPLTTLLGSRAPFDDVAASLAARAVRGHVELLECAMTGPRLRFARDAVTAWCDPNLAIRVQRVKAGDELAIGRIAGGLRGYLAIGDDEGVVTRMLRGERRVIHALRGPHDVGLGRVECEVTPQLDRIGIRLRPLASLDVVIPASLRSIGMQRGTVQLHPDGSLVAMGPDHPITGGYLQPMTVLTSERWKLAQLMPGERVTLIAHQ